MQIIDFLIEKIAKVQMKVVIGSYNYVCNDDELPDRCYYIDDELLHIVGKFGDLSIVYCAPGFIDEYVVCKELNINIRREICNEMKDIVRDYCLMKYDAGYQTEAERNENKAASLLGFVENHNTQIDVICGKISDIYIEHCGTSTKSAQSLVYSH